MRNPDPLFEEVYLSPESGFLSQEKRHKQGENSIGMV